jgi:glycolate oxidase iron-sulfur subunit
MQTQFAPAQLTDPALSEANAILRTCVHCGFCLATCPTYLLRGDELDSPRGRIYLAKVMLETGKPARPAVIKHLDRCLTCRSCMTTCPSGVDYGHLIERARARVETEHRRPLPDRLLRRWLGLLVPNPPLFRLALRAARPLRPVARLLPGRLQGMVAMAPKRLPRPSASTAPRTHPARGPRRARLALLPGCVQTVLHPEINEATIRLLTRHGCNVVIARKIGCCGAIATQLGDERSAKALARRNVAAWAAELERGLDGVVFNASGCGVALRDYGHLLRDDPQWAEAAARISALSRDVSEILGDLGPLAPAIRTGQRVVYQAACTMQHGLGIREAPKTLLSDVGFAVREPAESHICCGSAGVYSVLQPGMASELRARKLANLMATEPEIIASGNIGCISYLGEVAPVPVVHSVELLDWATGGPRPEALSPPGAGDPPRRIR